MQVLTTQRLVRSWSAWVGTKDELLRVVKLVEDETEVHKQSQIQRIDDQLPDRFDISDARLLRQRVELREQTTTASVTECDGFKHFGSPTEAVKRADIRVLRDVEIDCLNPGWMDTPGEDVIQCRFHTDGQDWLDEAEARQPFGQLIKPDEVARAVAFLASGEAGVTTGSIVDYDQSTMGGGAQPVPTPEETP